MTSQVYKGSEMIDPVVFEEVWKDFTERFSTSDKDLLHGYMIIKAMCAILEEAFNIVPPDIEVDKDGE